MAIKKSKARRRSVHTENPRQIVFKPPIFRKITRSSGLYRLAPMDEEIPIIDLSEGSVTDSVSPSAGTIKHQQENEPTPTLFTLAAVETNKNHGVPIDPNTEDSLEAERKERRRCMAYEEHKDKVWRDDMQILNQRALNGFPPFPLMHTLATPTQSE